MSDSHSSQSAQDLATQAIATAQDDVIDTTVDEVQESDDLATTLNSLQNVIERNVNRLDEVSAKLKELRQSLKNVFDNDGSFQEAQTQAQEVTSQVREHKARLNSDPTVVRLKTEIAELNTEKKEFEETISSHLLNYYQLTHSNSYDTSDGDQREFVIKAKLKPAK